MYELTRQGLPVLLTDLDAIWVKDPLPYMLAAGREQPQGYDLIVSRGYFPSEVYKTFKVAGKVVSPCSQPIRWMESYCKCS
jgi:hypothetical protein